MELIKIIEQQRKTYLNQLTEFYRTRTTGAKEILLELNGEEQERTFKLYRLDHYEQIDGEGKPTELAPDTYVNHPPVTYTVEKLALELNPFYWHGCEFILETRSENWDWLINWTKKWIDENDSNVINDLGFSSVIHNVMRPVKKGPDEYSFSVDFGTAPVESFMDLIQVITAQQIQKLKIGSFQMIPE